MYDFETLINRSGVGAAKWDEMYDLNPNVEDGVIPLSVADMEFRNAPEIIEALKQYLDITTLGYPMPTDSYFNAICNWMSRRHNWKIDREWIVQYAGVVPSIYAMTELLTDLKDGVIIMTPVYYPFYNVVNKTGRTLVECPLIQKGDSFVIDFELLEQQAKEKNTKLLILCNPHNPVGRVWTCEELKHISEICIRNDVFVISDEIHSDLILPGYAHTCYATLSEEASKNCAVCTAPSKTFNLAGLSTSHIIIKNNELRRRLNNLMDRRGMWMLNSMGYIATEIAYDKCEAWLEELLPVLDRNRKLVEDFMRENIPEIKVFRLEGTYLQWLDFRGLGMNYQELEKFMQQKAQLFLDEGHVFGTNGQGYERFNIACPTHALQAALDRLLKAVLQYKAIKK